LKFHTVDTLFRWSRNIYKYSAANIFRTISTKFYQNRPDFVDDETKTFGVFFGFAVSIAVHLQNAMLSFTR